MTRFKRTCERDYVSKMVTCLKIILLVSCFFGFTLAQASVDADVKEWSTQLSTIFNNLRDIMNLAYYEKSYQTMGSNNLLIEDTIDDEYSYNLLKSVIDKIEDLMAAKLELVENIRQKIEDTFKSFTYNENITCKEPFTYNRAKAINLTGPPPDPIDCQSSSYVALTPDPLMEDIYDNRTVSTVHIPTNVYDGSVEIMNVANWTSGLDEVFLGNLKIDPSVKWQYFGSNTGFFKIFPGIMWHIQIEHASQASTKVDFFDCRSQNWYLEAVGQPRDIVIIVDSSGSMKGRRNIIANHTAFEILNTLTENDFFNIIHFNDSAYFVDPTVQNRLVQATKKNKAWMINKLSNAFKPQGIASYKIGLTAAFKLLRSARINGTRKVQGSQAIMVISDGAPDSCEDVFKEYNAQREVRVFTYLIGQSVTDEEPVRQMACNNKGYSVQISTLADVKENVQKYLDVMGRTDPYDIDRFATWTGIHDNQMEPGDPNDMPTDEPVPQADESSASLASIVSDNTTTYNLETGEPKIQKTLKKIEMFVSVAQSAYDLRNQTTKGQLSRLLGVAGLDVPISDFLKFAPPSKLGVNGYLFGVTNNGFLLFHPNLRPNVGQVLKPYYMNVDLAEVLIPVDVTQTEPMVFEDEVVSYENMTIRDDMINQTTGDMMALDYIITYPFRTAFLQNYKFFYMGLKRTPYSIGLAMPWEETTGLEIPVLNTASTKIDNLKEADLGVFSASMVKGCEEMLSKFGDGFFMSPFKFCQFDSNMSAIYNKDPTCALRTILLDSAKQTSLKCDTDYLKQLFSDASGTKDAQDVWKKNWEGNPTIKQLGITQSMVMHFTGIIRVFNTSMPAFNNFILEHKDGIQDPLYKSTVLAATNFKNPDILVFTTEQSELVKNMMDNNQSVPVTVSSQIGPPPGFSTPLGVAAVQIDLANLTEVLRDVGGKCINTPCVSCSSEDVNCYLVNSAGIIVTSTQNARISGQSLKFVDCPLVESMIAEGIFKQFPVYDFQASCTVIPDSKGSFSTRLLDPISKFISTLLGFVFNFGTFMAEFSLSSLLSLFSSASGDSAREITQDLQSEDSMIFPATNDTNEDEINQRIIAARQAFATCALEPEMTYCVQRQVSSHCRQAGPSSPFNCAITCRVLKQVQPRLWKIEEACQLPTTPCAKSYSLLKGLWSDPFIDPSKSSVSKNAYCQSKCERKWWASAIAQTDLLVIMVQSNGTDSCSCFCNIPYRYGIKLKVNSTKILDQPPRMNPPWQYEDHIAGENSTVCSNDGFRLLRSLSVPMGLLSVLSTMVANMLLNR